MTDRPIYLDYQATTPVDPRVLDAMLPWFGTTFGNPHSGDHAYGWEAADAVRTARANVAALINADDDEIIFTSGATESCNLALRGVVRASGNQRRKIITLATEHPAVFETVQDLQRDGYEAIILPVGEDGLLDLADLKKVLDEDTLFVSVMAANNEIGVLQPLPEIAQLCRKVGALLHTDATQAPGRVGVDVDEWDVDLLSISAHKFYGPKGIGALYVRSGVNLDPVVTGGGQEKGLRPGTVPTALAVGFGEAAKFAYSEWECDAQRMKKFTDILKSELSTIRPDACWFGHPSKRVPGNLSVAFPGSTADEVIALVSPKIAISTGSACSSGTSEPSRVLLSLGLDPEVAAGGVRLSLGRFTTENEVLDTVNLFTVSSPSPR